MNGSKHQAHLNAQFSAFTGMALAAGLAVATPAHGFAEYLGGGYIRMSDACTPYGWTGTHQVMVRLEPQGVDANPADITQMSLLFGTGTMAVRLNLDRGIRHSYTPTQATYVWNGPWTPDAPTMTFAFSPNGTWPLAGGVELRGVHAIIDNFNEHAGCSAHFYANLRRG